LSFLLTGSLSPPPEEVSKQPPLFCPPLISGGPKSFPNLSAPSRSERPVPLPFHSRKLFLANLPPLPYNRLVFPSEYPPPTRPFGHSSKVAPFSRPSLQPTHDLADFCVQKTRGVSLVRLDGAIIFPPPPSFFQRGGAGVSFSRLYSSAEIFIHLGPLRSSRFLPFGHPFSFPGFTAGFSPRASYQAQPPRSIPP